jgi:hypothetical protein
MLRLADSTPGLLKRLHIRALYVVTHGRGVGWGGQAYRQKYILAIAKAKAKLAILAKNQNSESLFESSLVRNPIYRPYGNSLFDSELKILKWLRIGALCGCYTFENYYETVAGVR